MTIVGPWKSWARVLALVMAVCVAGVAPGCASGRADTSKTGYAALYDQGRFGEAYDAAAKEATGRGVHRDRAALYAGLSAYRLGRAGDAQRHLTPLIEHADAGIAGRANTALGSLSAEQGTHGAAAAYFLRASTRLTGDDAARALMYAGDARFAQGQREEAKQLWGRARDKVASDASLRVAIGDRLAGVPPAGAAGRGGAASSGGTGGSGTFTVQAGAFSTRQAADRLAGSLAGRGDVRVVPIRDSRGRMLHAVRVGRYSTREQAESVRRSIGGNAIVTQATNE
jgi:hypothetical protein